MNTPEEITAELADLRRWKAEQLAVESTWHPQELGKLLRMPLGCSIRHELMLRVPRLVVALLAVQELAQARFELSHGPKMDGPHTEEERTLIEIDSMICAALNNEPAPQETPDGG